MDIFSNLNIFLSFMTSKTQFTQSISKLEYLFMEKLPLCRQSLLSILDFHLPSLSLSLSLSLVNQSNNFRMNQSISSQKKEIFSNSFSTYCEKVFSNQHRRLLFRDCCGIIFEMQKNCKWFYVPIVCHPFLIVCGHIGRNVGRR